MASYTMKLQTLIDGYSQDQPFLPIRNKITTARPKLFDFDYPFFDEGLRSQFEEHFIRRFYMREIGFETEGLFKFQLENWLLQHMPYYNKLFDSETITFNPLENIDFTVTTSLNKQKQQNDEVDRTEDETENESENRVLDATANQTTHNEESGTENKTTDRTETGNVETDTIQDNTNTTTGEASTNSEKDSTINNDKTFTTNTDTDTTGSEFHRKLQSETGDERLAITTNDGVGVIEYASNIEENKNTSSGNEQKNESGQSTDDTIGNETATEATTSSQVETGNQTGNEKTDVSNTVGETVAETQTKNQDGTNNVIKNDTETRQQDLTKNRIGNQKLNSVVEMLETYSKQEKGKTGSETYSKMLQDYRNTFLRIEKELFDEMSVLFMGVY